ncbi:MAG: hypothetical protein DRH15_15465 [Deltaproteobacteria bacterium]|nr:MAG: hypothetical protein DRH15_15465 [Deltaproteobacteria bacterium]
MAILASYFPGETYGLLGPQMAATLIEENTPYDCIVIAVTRANETAAIMPVLADFFGSQRPVVGFSTLSGRQDLFTLAGQLKDHGAITILAGPQSDVDYAGEVDWQIHNHRFRGFSREFSFALHGPAEQIIPLLKDPGTYVQAPGYMKYTDNGVLLRNPEKPWKNQFLTRVKWDNIFLFEQGSLKPLKISDGQVIQQIGCPYAAHGKWIEIDYPVSFSQRRHRKVRLFSKGCSFCDVAVDKGFSGLMDMETVLAQIQCLPIYPPHPLGYGTNLGKYSDGFQGPRPAPGHHPRSQHPPHHPSRVPPGRLDPADRTKGRKNIHQAWNHYRVVVIVCI